MPLADFRDSLRRPFNCQLIVAEDRLLASVAGCVLAFAPTGRMHWIRRQIYIPPAGPDYQNSQPWLAQHHEPLHVSPGRVYATQPGVWGMECVDLDSGRILWRQAAGSLARVAGKVDDRMILETTDGPVALDAQTGKVVWMRYVRQCQATRVCGDPRSVVCLGTQTSRSKGKETSEGITLSWYNPQDGQPMGQCSVEARTQPGCLLGPLAAAENRQWIALANPQQPAQREWLEAVRTGDAD